MTLVLVEDADLRAFARVLAQVFGVQIDAEVQNVLIQTLIQKVQNMSDTLNTKLDAADAKVDQLVAAVGSLEQRVAANDAKLAAAEAARDQAVTDLASTKTTLDGVRAELAAIPQVDTASIESRLEGESTKVQGAIDRLNAIDVTPAPAPAPADNAPASTDPNAPSGTEVPL